LWDLLVPHLMRDEPVTFPPVRRHALNQPKHLGGKEKSLGFRQGFLLWDLLDSNQ